MNWPLVQSLLEVKKDKPGSDDDSYFRERDQERQHWRAIYDARDRYKKLADDLARVEEQTGTHLYDYNEDVMDATNDDPSTKDEDSAEFWNNMYSACKMRAGIKAENKGLDINKLLGYIIY